MMSLTQEKEFMLVIAENLERIKGLFFAQIPHNNQEDILQDCILKVACRIRRAGLKVGSDYIAYLFLAYRNTIYTANKKKVKIVFVEDAALSEACNLIDNQEKREEELIERLEREQLIDEVFELVKLNYTPLQFGFFSYYHKTKLSYREISEATGYSISYIFKTNKRILDELKTKYGKI
jgi:RNA polymerase sigma factor (sigma-70 family)